jgi:thiosulfate oxidation carrier complex protein SoxZ
MQRRTFIHTLLGLCLVPLHALAAVWNKPAFEATNLQQATQGLAIDAEIPTDDITIIAPDRAENGAVVQVEVMSKLANTEALALFVAENPTPLIANVMLSSGTQARLVTRIKMAQTSQVKVVAKVGNQYYSKAEQVVVLEDGCGGSDTDAKFESSMKMRAKLVDEIAEVKVIIVHPMTTGRAKNSAGQLIPAHFIQTLEATLNGNKVLEAHCSTAISKNPYFTFYVAGAKLGDTVMMKWQDNMGYQGQSEIKVSL